MATWTNIKTYSYSGAFYSYNPKVTATLQYDADSVTPTSVKLRFQGARTGSYYGLDRYYILWAPGTSSETLKLLKGSNVDAIATSTFTVTKTYSEAKFAIPEFWIINTGSVTPNSTLTDGRYTITYYNDSTGKNQTLLVYKFFKTETWWHNSRQSYKTAFSSASTAIASSKTVATNPVPKKPTITDNGDNTFTIKGSAATAGTNNPVKSTKLRYKIGSADTVEISSLTLSNAAITAAKGDATQTIKANTRAIGTYGGDVKSETVSKKINNYQAPGNPGKPVITWEKSRMTIKEPWTVSWTAAKPANSSSLIKGYRVRLYKNGKTIPIIDNDGDVHSTLVGTDYRYDRKASLGTSMKIYPAECGIKAGDRIKVGLYAYTTNGVGKVLWSGSGKNEIDSDDENDKDRYVVRNAGIVHVKKSDTWYEGQVYVKKNDRWEEAEAVYTKVDGSWEESE